MHLARYAARSVGFTAVPVIQGMPAVATTTTCLRSGRAVYNLSAVLMWKCSFAAAAVWQGSTNMLVTHMY